MSKTTSGRRLLDALEKRVAKIEGNPKPEPIDEVREELADIHRRLKRIEADMANPQGNNQSGVAKDTLGIAGDVNG